MKITEKLDVIIEKHPLYESLNKKLLEDAQVATWGGDTTPDLYEGDTASFSGAHTNSKSIDLIFSWTAELINNRYSYMRGFRLRLLSSWFVRYGRGDETPDHDHLPALYSWVYFIKCPKGSPPLTFTNSGKRIKSEEGKIVIFPSVVRHYVSKSNCDDRLVLVGNINTL